MSSKPMQINIAEGRRIDGNGSLAVHLKRRRLTAVPSPLPLKILGSLQERIQNQHRIALFSHANEVFGAG